MLDQPREYNSIDVKPIAGALGAEIFGADLSKPLNDETFGEIYRAWLDHLVIFFRDQEITPAQYIEFANKFGEIHTHPLMKGLDDYPEVLEILKNEDDTYTFGNSWHTDQIFTDKPAKASMLYAKETPPYGGDTLFANMYLAYDALSDGMEAMIGGLRALNKGDNYKRRKQTGDHRSRAERYAAAKTTMKLKEKPDENRVTEAVHPVVRTHPETGRKSLYISVHTETLEGFNEDEADIIIDQLREHAMKPEFVCRFNWRPGSIALWDNRCTQHYAMGDYQGFRRRMHRLMIKGDTPV
ncbi:MAG: TauD/TfdA family dioxygenase [Rhodospirillaceae bacterium]|jgi:taurine dioxygenase